MWIIFAYRKISSSQYKKYLSSLLNHILFLKKHFHIVFPQEVSCKKWVQVSLFFDYASADFYYTIFPFLFKHNVKAILGVPCRYILNEVTCHVEKRLVIPDGIATLDDVFLNQQPFCSWKELLEMKKSHLIDFASHGFAIRNLKNRPDYLSKEIVLSKEILENKLSQPIRHFIYPLGVTDHTASTVVRETYEYSFLLGNALNTRNRKHSIRRIDSSNVDVLNNSLAMKSFLQYIKNTCFYSIKNLLSKKI